MYFVSCAHHVGFNVELQLSLNDLLNKDYVNHEHFASWVRSKIEAAFKQCGADAEDYIKTRYNFGAFYLETKGKALVSETEKRLSVVIPICNPTEDTIELWFDESQGFRFGFTVHLNTTLFMK